METAEMGKHIFDYSDGDYEITISDNVAMDTDGDLMLRIGDNMAVAMDSGELHITSSWPKDEEDD
jgi:hypothetical protein